MTITDFECGIDRIKLSGMLGSGFDANALRAESLIVESLGRVRIVFSDLSSDIANRFGAADFAKKV